MEVSSYLTTGERGGGRQSKPRVMCGLGDAWKDLAFYVSTKPWVQFSVTQQSRKFTRENKL